MGLEFTFHFEEGVQIYYDYDYDDVLSSSSLRWDSKWDGHLSAPGELDFFRALHQQDLRELEKVMDQYNIHPDNMHTSTSPAPYIASNCGYTQTVSFLLEKKC